ncbi:NAD(P)/FAD-dependent oxidoreductase [Streptomyces sp. URMC 123]|uniref:NAD(P)/FAD-dependent oxidoreductase n=1 Tax=Streptomyces sp. URMC 123 TaxID=3423403 RepID=UPI003F1CEC8E
MTANESFFDTAVVGAGVIGCMTAQRVLDHAPGTTLALLDQDAVAAGATRRSAGLHFPRGATERVRRMSAFSQDHYARLRADRPDLPIRPLGMTVVAAAAGEVAVREAYLDSARLTPVDRVPGGLVELPPGHLAWDGAGCQYADVAALTQILARELRERATVHEGVRVTAVRPEEHGIVLDLGTGRTLTAGRVVLAPGPWLAAPAWRDLVAPLGARVKKVVALHIERPPAPGDHTIVLHDEDAFLLPLHERGHWLFSYTCQEWDVTPDELGDGVSAAHLREAREVLGRYAPALVDHCVSGRVFCDAYGPHGEPLVTPLAGDPRLVLAGAASGSGYRLAPAIAAEAAGLLPPPCREEKDEK